MSTRIGIDGYNLALPNGTGVATYGLTLGRTLAGAGHRIEGVFGIDAGTDPAAREIAFFDRLGRPEEITIEERRRRARHRLIRTANPLHRARAVEVPLTGRVVRDGLADRLPPFDRIVTSPRLFEDGYRYFRTHGRLMPLAMPDPPAVMHWTYPVPVRLAGARNIYTIHDLVPLRLPFTTLDNKPAYRALVGACIAAADAICTVSEASRADILAEYGCNPAHVVTCYQTAPVDPAALSEDAALATRAIRATYGLETNSYFLYLGAAEPKKNLGRLLEAYLSMETATPLVMVSGRGWQSAGELRLLEPSGNERFDRGRRLAERVIWLEHLPRGLLFRLIRSARAVLFPSIFEGFGLPVLEAMTLGTPVLTSNRSSLPEVAGEAALLVDPYEVGAIRDGIVALDSDAALRARLAAAGLLQAETFSEARYVDRLRMLYARAGIG